jgi:hypothetical protein
VNKSILDQEYWVSILSQKIPEDNTFLSKPPSRLVIFLNPINSSSMRLSKIGYTYLKNYVKLVCYEFNLKNKIKPKTLLQLEKFIQYPYYVFNHNKIVVFDEQTAIMLQLHNNDLETFLNNLEEHQ